MHSTYSTYWLILILGGPGVLLVYLSNKLFSQMRWLFRQGRIHDMLMSMVALVCGTLLLISYGNEKTILVVALLSWIFLASAFIRFLMRDDRATSKRVSRYTDAPNDQDPNSIHFSGVGRGFQGFGLYAGGVRIGHDPIDDD